MAATYGAGDKATIKRQNSGVKGGDQRIVNIALKPEQNTIIACAFGTVLAVIQIWMLWEPTWFVMKDRQLKVSMRHTEVVILLCIGLALLLMSSSAVLSFSSI